MSETNAITTTSSSNLSTIQLIQEINSAYTAKTIAYADGIKRYSTEIKKIQAEIEAHQKKKAKDEDTLKKAKADIAYDQKLLARLNEQFESKAESALELENEYKDILQSSEYAKILKRKKSDIQLLGDEIEEIEISMLSKELERLNLLAQLEPKRELIEKMRSKQQELELEKEYFENTNLSNLTQNIPKNALPGLYESPETAKNETIETEIIDRDTDDTKD